jgi:hypothetical protein
VKAKLQVKHLHKARKLSEEQSKEDTKKPPVHLKTSSEKKHLQGGHKKQRYENVFNGHCFSCNEYGHKALDCRHHSRKEVGRLNNMLRCWRCNLVGHIVAHCHTMRCYSCSGFGYKSQDCWNTRRQSMKSASYSMKRRTPETRKEDKVKRMEDKRSGYSQKWMKKIEQP